LLAPRALPATYQGMYAGYPPKWVRPWGPRLAMLVSWSGTVSYQIRVK